MIAAKRIMMIVFILTLSLGTSAFGVPLQQEITPAIEISVDGEAKPLADGQSIHIIESRAYVPLRYLAESFSVDAGWHPGRKVAFIGQGPEWKAVDLDPIANAEPLPIRFYFEGIKKELPPGLKIFVEDSIPYVPLRFMAETMGNEVIWVPGNERNFIRIQKAN